MKSHWSKKIIVGNSFVKTKHKQKTTRKLNNDVKRVTFCDSDSDIWHATKHESHWSQRPRGSSRYNTHPSRHVHRAEGKKSYSSRTVIAFENTKSSTSQAIITAKTTT